MTTPIAEDFSHIAARLKQIEDDKTKALSAPDPAPLPDVQPIYGYGYMGPDYDPVPSSARLQAGA